MAKVASKGSIKRLADSLDELSKKRSTVGFFDTATYPDGTPVASVAAIQEFGAGKIPPRSFMRSTVAEQKDAWKTTLAKGARYVLAGELTVEQMLDVLGQSAAGQIKEKIASITAPGLSGATIASRLRRNNTSTKPLVDTGYMISSVDSKVEAR